MHDHSHGHSHSEEAEGRSLLTTSDDQHRQSHEEKDVLRRLKIASCLCAGFLIVEVIGGWLAGSLAVMSDAAHLFADLASFAVAIVAAHLGSMPSSDHHTFGLKRVESLAALFSMVTLALVSVALAVEAVGRLVEPPPEGVDGKLMSTIAFIGVCVNVVLAFVLGEDHVHMPGGDDHSHEHDHGHDHCHDDNEDKEQGHSHDHDDDYGAVSHSNGETPAAKKEKQRNINLQAAYLHVLGDLAQSVAVLIAGVTIWFKPDWRIVDPIVTLLFCALVFRSTLGVLRSSISVLLQEVPSNMSWENIYKDIEATEGVSDVHDLHIWSISHGVPSLSVHVMASGDSSATMQNVYNVCKKHGIDHATIQVQREGEDCVTCTSNHGEQRRSSCHDYSPSTTPC